jgi:hypothetical protein
MIIDTNARMHSGGARPRLAPRSLEEIYSLPANALLTPAETALVTRLTESALSVRRSKGRSGSQVALIARTSGHRSAAAALRLC